MEQIDGLSKTELYNMLQMKMPFGRYGGRYLVNIPYEYYSWCIKQGMDKNELGKFMRFLYQAHLDGSIDILRGQRWNLVKSLQRELKE